MKFVFNLVLFVVLSIGIVHVAAAQYGAPRFEGRTGLATLYARDPLTQSLCLRDGGPGGSFHQGQTRNRCSDLNFDSYLNNAFTVGVEGGKQGVILDLGTPSELKGKYGYQETVGNGQGFASIDVREGKALILKDYPSGQLQELAESANLFKVPESKSSSAPVKVGHIYLMRLTDRHDAAFELTAKFVVIAYVPGESVTVRWQLLSDAKTAKL